jgi:hypothetical protein
MMEMSADPPTIKNAGHINSYGASAFIGSLALLGVAALVAGGMLLAVMASHGDRRRGWVLHAALGSAALGLLLLSSSADAFVTVGDVLGVAAGVGVLWLLVAGMALAIARTRPPGKARRRA